MAKLMHPQLRAPSALSALIESRPPSFELADEWLSRGWNPFLPQKSVSWRAQDWRAKETGIDRMMADGMWHGWILERKAQWPPLAEAAFTRSELGHLIFGSLLTRSAAMSWGGHEDLLSLFLNLGADPDVFEPDLRLPHHPLFEATRHGAQKLLDAGAQTSFSGPDGRSLWEHWAARALHKSLTFEDLDWMASFCPVSWRAATPLGRLAFEQGCLPLIERLERAGAPLSSFSAETPRSLRQLLTNMFLHGDPSAALEPLARVAGIERVLNACVDDSEGPAPLCFALFKGRVKSLGFLERSGLLSIEGATPRALAAWGAQAWSSSTKGSFYGHYAAPAPSGMVWVLSRMKPADARAAQDALLSCVASYPMLAQRLVQTCASKGLLNDSGPASVASLYQDGALWNLHSRLGNPRPMDFSEFVSLCESKAFKRAFKKKTKASDAPPRRRL